MMRRVKGPPKPAPIKGKTLILGVLAALVVTVGLLFWAGMTGGSTHIPLSAPGIGFTTDDAGSNAAPAETPAAAGWDGGALAKTVHDPKVRDELRKRILAGWAASPEPEVAAAAKQGRFVPAPEGPDGGRMDPKYIQEVVRGEFFPMAEKCYEELLTRKKGDGGMTPKGRVEMSFTIVADEKLGGILEDVEAKHDDAGLADEKMTTCMRESMSSLAFRPPAHGGYVTVVYPIEFAPDSPGEAGADR
jgi:hypothetical protein